MFPLYGTPYVYFDEYLKNLTLTNAIERFSLQKQNYKVEWHHAIIKTLFQ